MHNMTFLMENHMMYHLVHFNAMTNIAHLFNDDVMWFISWCIHDDQPISFDARHPTVDCVEIGFIVFFLMKRKIPPGQLVSFYIPIDPFSSTFRRLITLNPNKRASEKGKVNFQPHSVVHFCSTYYKIACVYIHPL